jgi:acylglycerol lipase
VRGRRAAALAASLLLVGSCALGPASPAADDAPPPATVARWAPPAAPRAVVLALHGFNDRKAGFDEFGAFAAARGVLVVAYDQSGFGARPNRGRWPGAGTLAAEARERARDLRARHPGVPLFVLGESMGAAVATLAFGGGNGRLVDGVVLSAPAVWGGDAMPSLYRRALTVAALVAPAWKLTGRGVKVQASDNIPALIELGRDPLYIRETRVDAVAGLVALMDEARDAAPALAAPTLVVTGARDEIVPPQAQRDFVAALPAGRCTAATYLNGWHLLLRDLQRERVYRDILAWIGGERRLPSGLGRPCGGGAAPAA